MRMKIRTIALVLLALLLALPAWAQTAPQPPNPPNSRNLDQLGLQLHDQQQSPGPAGEGARATQAAQAPQATQEKIISPQEAKELFKSVDEILEFASQETKLPIKEEVKRRLVERNEVQSYIQKNMKEDKDAQRLERSEIVLKKFGLLPRNFDLKTFLVALLKEQVAGYYDPKTKTVNLLNWVDAYSQRPVLAHELTHALQDQSFGLEKWMRVGEQSNHVGDPSPDDISTDEVQAARQAVVEGQAMVTLLDYSLAPTGKTMLDMPQITDALKEGMLVGTADTPTFRTAPVFLKETLTFPYRYGMDFTAALLNAGGKELAFAGVFKNPPSTTREIMEPQTYLSHEKLEPMRLLDFDKDFKGYDRFDIGAIGEFDVAVLVEQYAGEDEARELYPHWRGGYYFAGRPKGDKSAPLGVLYVSRWSSPEKAAEFAAVYAKSLAQRYQRPRALGADGKVADDAPPVDSWRTLRGRHAWLTEEGPVVIEVRGDAILISESLDDETSKRVTVDFWGGIVD
ncbi:MAG: hypothetical protein WAQ52_19280 [Terriglobales bacterium]